MPQPKYDVYLNDLRERDDGSSPSPAPARVIESATVPALADGETADWYRPATGVMLHVAKVGGKVYGCEMTEL